MKGTDFFPNSRPIKGCRQRANVPTGTDGVPAARPLA